MPPRRPAARNRAAGTELDAYRWATLSAATTGQFVISLIEQGLAIMIPSIQLTFGLNGLGVGLITSSANTGRLLGSMAAGRLVAGRGERRAFLIGGVGAGACALAAGLAGSEALVLFFLFAFGVAIVPGNIAGISAVSQWFNRRSRGLAVGVRQAAVSAGGVASSLVFPGLLMTFGWRPTLGGAGLLAAVTTLVAWRWFVEPGVPDGRGAEWSWRAFGELLRARSFAVTIVVGVALMTLQAATLAHIAVYLHTNLRESLYATGALLAVAQGCGAAARIGWGVLSDRLFAGGRPQVLLLILVLSAAVCVILGRLAGPQPLSVIVPLVMAIGITAFGWPGVWVTHVVEVAGPRLAPSALGAAFGLTLIGGLVGPLGFGYLVDVSQGYFWGWTSLATVVTLAGGVSFFGRDARRSMNTN